MLRSRAAETGIDAVTETDTATQLTIELSERDGRTCVTLTGELDGVSAPPLRDQLADLMAEPLAGDLVLDIAGLTFLDSTALTLFVSLHNQLESKGHELILQGPSPIAARIFDITGLVNVLRVEPPPS